MKGLEADESLHINELPDIPLRRIFSFLPILERLDVEKVCKRWRMIGEEGWPDVTKLKIKRKYSDDIILLILKRCGSFLKELALNERPESLILLSMIIQLCELDQLKSISIHMSDDPKDKDVELVICQLRKIFEKATKLVKMEYYGPLELYGTNWLNSANLRNLIELHIINYSDEPSSINPDWFPNLKKLFLYNIEIVGGEMKRDEESLKGLEIIEIYGFDVSHDLNPRIETFENLQQLILRDHSYNMKNEHIRNIALNCRKLKEMNVMCSFHMTSECFEYLGTMPSLKILKLSRHVRVNNRHIPYLMNVNHLSFDGCSGDLTGDGVIELITESTNLEHLKLSCILLLNMAFLNDVRQIFRRSQRTKPLTLHVSADSWSNEVTPVVGDHHLLTLRISHYSPDCGSTFT